MTRRFFQNRRSWPSGRTLSGKFPGTLSGTSTSSWWPPPRPCGGLLLRRKLFDMLRSIRPENCVMGVDVAATRFPAPEICAAAYHRARPMACLRPTCPLAGRAGCARVTCLA